MRRVVFGRQAERDIDEVWSRIAADNIDAAQRMIEHIEQAAGLLARMPGAGHERADVDDPRYRFWTVRPYVIAYRYTSRTVTIVRVIHGARDFWRVFRRRK